MILSKQLQGLLLVCALGTPSLVNAATTSEVINGAMCIPYPPYRTDVAIPYQHVLYFFSQTAYCHLTMREEWPVQNLSYVLFNGFANSNVVLTGRLCVHSGDFSVTCGASQTISGGGFVNWVLPPSPMPQYASGAFMHFTTSGYFSIIQQVIPVWYK